MRLIKVETQGFKSFADKISLTFDGQLVGIVGPNGSGKSNINDAIKWVLGEMSPKSLRGDSMEDVIFSGSKTMSAMNQAYVALTFDNSQGKLSLPYKTFTISRVLKRGQTSQYFINNQVARLKDIREIALESGMSKSSLAIISQGTVQDIAQASPEQRRLFFEEAAGIAKYKSRKLEALRKLEKTTEALDKVKTVVEELERQLKPLKRQAAKATLYLEKKAELKKVEVSLIAEDLIFYGQKLEELNHQLLGVEETKDTLEKGLERLDQELITKNKHKLELDSQVHELDNKYQTLAQKLEAVLVRDNLASQQRKLIIDGHLKANNQAKIEALNQELESLVIKINHLKQLENQYHKTLEQRKKILNELNEDIYRNQTIFDKNNHSLLSLKTKIGILEDQKQNKSNLFRGVKTILENKATFLGIDGIVADIIEVDPQYQKAIEVVLQNALQHLVVQKSEDAIKAINFLKKNKSGRASFIPLDTIKPKTVILEHHQIAKKQNGFVAIANQIVKTKEKYQILSDYLLGNILVTETIEDANQLYKIFRNYTIITLDGNVIRPGGSITGGYLEKTISLLGVDQQIDLLYNQLPSLETQINQTKTEIALLTTRHQEEQSLIGANNLDLVKINQKLQINQSQYHLLKNQYESFTKSKFETKTNFEIDQNFENLQQEKSSLGSLIKVKRETAINLNNDLMRLISTKNDLDKNLREILSQHSQKITQKNQAQYILENGRQRLVEEYELTIEAAKDFQKLTIDREKAREIVNKIKQEIKEIGHINIDAIQDAQEIEQRFNKIKSNETELFKAQQTILSAIDKMDQVIISRLDSTVASVNKEMESIFKVMFGGGSAQVKYNNPNNILESGIDVIAQPPGKTVRNLKLFSGGEKSLIAISLLFAILKSKPLPLCILDEVEAALDDANVVRYADYLQALKDKTQFIVVTHRVGTMARVDKLFGATMQKRGVTSFFSVALSQAKTLLKEV